MDLSGISLKTFLFPYTRENSIMNDFIWNLLVEYKAYVFLAIIASFSMARSKLGRSILRILLMLIIAAISFAIAVHAWKGAITVTLYFFTIFLSAIALLSAIYEKIIGSFFSENSAEMPLKEFIEKQMESSNAFIYYLALPPPSRSRAQSNPIDYASTKKYLEKEIQKQIEKIFQALRSNDQSVFIGVKDVDFSQDDETMCMDYSKYKFINLELTSLKMDYDVEKTSFNVLVSMEDGATGLPARQIWTMRCTLDGKMLVKRIEMLQKEDPLDNFWEYKNIL